MTSTIKVNNIQNQCGQNIINENSNTITIGASGDTISLASGASQTGFGREGSVDWQTGSIKTTTFTATSGEGYFVDTSSGAVTVNLPAGSAGAIVAFADYTRTFGTHNLTITPNGSNKIGGFAASATLSTDGESATFVFVDSTEGWINVQQTSTSKTGRTFITATGGTTSDCGNFRVHTFTGPGTFCVSAISTVPAENTVGYLVIAGGGAGGKADRGGGGGAGGYREGRNVPIDNFTASPLVADAPTNAVTLTASPFPITVGAGGTVTPNSACGNGTNSQFSTIIAAGGGAGATYDNPRNGLPGGSGGGATIGNGTAGSGNTPSVSPAQGKNGGGGPPGVGAYDSGAGGGGATAIGADGGTPAAGAGGAGATSSITGSPVARAGGGGGGSCSGSNAAAGTGGGGDGGKNSNSTPAQAGTANTGGGGGGNGPSPSTSGSGGSGVVIIRYKFQ